MLLAQVTLPTEAAANSTVGVSLAVAACGAALWFLALLWLVPPGQVGRFRVQLNIQKQHYIQALCQFAIYVYWGLYWTGVSNFAPFIAAQLLFAYLFEMLLSWTRGRVWQVRMGPFPIVFSINFFLWFQAPYFYLQLLLIAFTYLAKEFLTWQRNGRTTHIFNPSGISLAVASLILMGTGTIGKLTYGINLAISFYLAPNLYEVIFLMGLVVMFLFATTLLTLGSVVTLCALHYVFPITPAPVDVYVLLGLTFLVTDPSTSPRNDTGKFLFGAAYGVLIYASIVILRLLDQPSYFDKILPVPILNLMTPQFEVAGERLQRLLPPRLAAGRHAWAVHLAMYAGVFVPVLWVCKTPAVDFVDPLPKPSRRQQSVNAEMTERRVKRGAASLVYPEAHGPFGFRQEISYYHELRDFEPRTAQDHQSFGTALLAVGQVERALAHFRRALEIQPSLVPAHLMVGQVLWERQKLDEALVHLKLAADLSPSEAAPHVQLGTLLLALRRPTEAIPCFQRALEITPGDKEVRQRLDFAKKLQNMPLPAIQRPM